MKNKIRGFFAPLKNDRGSWFDTNQNSASGRRLWGSVGPP